MLKKTITYTDYDGVERTETFYFNLSRSELIEKEAVTSGGYANLLQRIIDSKDQASLMREFKSLVGMSYGEKTEDGRYFRKSPELTEKFLNSAAYDAMFVEFITDTDKAAEFVNGIMPKDLNKTIDAIARNASANAANVQSLMSSQQA